MSFDNKINSNTEKTIYTSITVTFSCIFYNDILTFDFLKVQVFNFHGTNKNV